MAKKSTKKVSTGMHYTTLAALIISNLTVLSLGVMFANSLVAGGGQELIYNQARTEIARTAHAASMNIARARGQFVDPGPASPSLALSNTFVGSSQVGGDLVYDFEVTVTNTGNTDFKAIEMTYAYDREVLQYRGTQGIAQKIKSPSLLEQLFLPKKAQAQVSIEFPMELDPTCELNVRNNPATCSVATKQVPLEAGESVSFVLQFTVIEKETIGYEGGWLHKLGSWLFGTNKAQAQVSIEFPTGGITRTVATITRAIDQNNWQLRYPISSTAAATLP